MLWCNLALRRHKQVQQQKSVSGRGLRSAQEEAAKDAAATSGVANLLYLSKRSCMQDRGYRLHLQCFGLLRLSRLPCRRRDAVWRPCVPPVCQGCCRRAHLPPRRFLAPCSLAAHPRRRPSASSRAWGQGPRGVLRAPKALPAPFSCLQHQSAQFRKSGCLMSMAAWPGVSPGCLCKTRLDPDTTACQLLMVFKAIAAGFMPPCECMARKQMCMLCMGFAASSGWLLPLRYQTSPVGKSNSHLQQAKVLRVSSLPGGGGGGGANGLAERGGGGAGGAN